MASRIDPDFDPDFDSDFDPDGKNSKQGVSPKA